MSLAREQPQRQRPQRLAAPGLRHLPHQIFHFLPPTPSWLRPRPCVQHNLLGPAHITPLLTSSALSRLLWEPPPSLAAPARVPCVSRFPLMAPVRPPRPPPRLTTSFYTIGVPRPSLHLPGAVVPAQLTCPFLRAGTRTSSYPPPSTGLSPSVRPVDCQSPSLGKPRGMSTQAQWKIPGRGKGCGNFFLTFSFQTWTCPRKQSSICPVTCKAALLFSSPHPHPGLEPREQ